MDAVDATAAAVFTLSAETDEVAAAAPSVATQRSGRRQLSLAMITKLILDFGFGAEHVVPSGQSFRRKTGDFAPLAQNR